MTKIARAAEIWARLEKHLIERCGLPNGRMLEVNRPYLVRWIGDRLKAVPVDVERRAAAGQTVSPPLPQPDAYAKRTKVRAPEMRPDIPVVELDPPVSMSGVAPRSMTARGNTIHDAKLAAYLDRACSLRGYDEDDTVDH